MNTWTENLTAIFNIIWRYAVEVIIGSVSPIYISFDKYTEKQYPQRERLLAKYAWKDLTHE